MALFSQPYTYVDQRPETWARVYERVCPAPAGYGRETRTRVRCGGELEVIGLHATEVFLDARGRTKAVRILHTLRCVVCQLAYAYDRIKTIRISSRKHWSTGVPL